LKWNVREWRGVVVAVVADNEFVAVREDRWVIFLERISEIFITFAELDVQRFSTLLLYTSNIDRFVGTVTITFSIYHPQTWFFTLLHLQYFTASP
jgi:hypothetical protein